MPMFSQCCLDAIAVLGSSTMKVEDGLWRGAFRSSRLTSPCGDACGEENHFSTLKT